jgi:TrmH family RNA methyltransferase
MAPGRAHLDTSSQPESSGTPAAPITSKENKWVKRFRAALAGDSGEPHVYGIEGPHLVEEALRSGVAIETVLACPAGEKHLERLGLAAAGPGPATQAPGAPRVLRTTDRLFASIAATETPQGIAALVRLPEYSFEDIVRGVPLVVVLIGVQDPGNVGTIVRSAEAFGATGLVSAAATASPYNPKAMRASAGSVFRLPMLVRAQPPVLLAQLRVAGAALVATTSGPSPVGPPPLEPHAVDLRGPVALLIGGEAHGLPEPVLRSADAAIRIPLVQPVESLNAAVAASVVLYESARQRAASMETPR